MGTNLYSVITRNGVPHSVKVKQMNAEKQSETIISQRP